MKQIYLIFRTLFPRYSRPFWERFHWLQGPVLGVNAHGAQKEGLLNDFGSQADGTAPARSMAILVPSPCWISASSEWASRNSSSGPHLKKKRSGGVKVHGTGPSRLGPNYCKLLHETVPKNISVQEQKDMGSSLNVGTNLAKIDILRT